MDMPSDQDIEIIWLEMRYDGRLHGFALHPHETRAIVVGALPGVNLQIAHPGVAALHFHIERDGRVLWVVPAYGAGDLRVNAKCVVSAQILPSCALIEFADVQLETFYANAAIAAQGLSCTPRGVDWSEAATVSIVAMTARGKAEPTHQQNALTQAQLPLGGNAAALDTASPQARQFSPIFKPAVVASQRVVPLAQPQVKVDGGRKVCCEEFVQAEVEEPLSQKTTVFDMPALHLKPRKPVLAWLACVGVLSRTRPWHVWGVGTFGVFVISGLVGLAHRQWVCTTQPSPNHLGNSPHPRPSTSLPATTAPSLPPNISSAVVQPVPSASSAMTDGEHRHPELASAVNHIVAGRYPEAQAIYASLSRRADRMQGLEVISRLLSKKLHPSCKNARSSTQISCPEIIP